jgi:sugar lactone lactonase YvrE
VKITCVADTKCLLGEGPVWDERAQVLYWVDIKVPAIWRLDPVTGTTKSWPMPHRVGAIALRANGGLIAAMKPGFAFIDLDADKVDIIAHPEPGMPDNRLNDGACDAMGRFWAGSMDDRETNPTGHLYRLSADRSVARFEAGFIVTNGIRWSNDNKRMYFVDSVARTIWSYYFDLATGTPGQRRVFAQLTEADGYPDGLCVDAQDHVWGAHWAGSRLTRYRPDGAKERTIEIPAPNVTCCCFGGANLDTLYVTTARIGLSDDDLNAAPQTGGVFAVTGLDIKGRTGARFPG